LSLPKHFGQCLDFFEQCPKQSITNFWLATWVTKFFWSWLWQLIFLGQSEIILKSALKKFSHLINNGHWSHNRIIFVIAQKNSIANLWSPTWIIENFWLLVNIRLDYWNFSVINCGNWKLVTKFFISITIRFMAALPCCDLGWP